MSTENQQDFTSVTRAYVEYLQANMAERQYSTFELGTISGYRRSMDFGRNLRDNWLHTYSVLPGAITTFIDVATSREWMVVGRMVTASRAVTRLNNSFMLDSIGIKHRGFENLLARFCMDWLTVGRGMFYSQPLSENERDWSELEYIDPAYTYPVTDKDTTWWKYMPRGRAKTRVMRQEHLFFLDNIRIGHSGSVVGRVAYLLPMANLDWLMRTHDSMQLDGRKIRDIFVVKEGMLEALNTAFLQYMALASQEDPSKHGLPVVEVGGLDGAAKIADAVHRIGISEVPREFSREELEGRYVREISATLGLPIGQFWYDPRGTNRSLEQVQQERSTLKGPAFFVRSFCRLINNSPMMGNTPGNRAVLMFEEETDNSSLLQQATAAKTYAEAATAVEALAPGIVQPQEWLEMFHRMRFIPTNTTMPGTVTIEEQSLKRDYIPYEGRLMPHTTMADVVNMELSMNPGWEKEEIMQKGYVKMDMNEHIIERRAEFQIGWKNAT